MDDGKVTSLEIRTPEGVSFSLPLAGPVSRFFAWIVDATAIMACMTLISMLLSGFSAFSPGVHQALLIVLYFALSIGYAMALEWFWRGQTLGKRVLGLRVVDESGLRLQFSQVAVRNLLRFVDSIPVLYLVGGASCLVSRRWQRLGDYAASTVVVRVRPAPEYDLDQIASGKFNSFRDYPHLEARLRQRATAEESALALRALLRRETLTPEARVDLMRELAAHFKSMACFPEEATYGLTDEQYVRNVVDSLFHVRGQERSRG